MRHYPPGHPDHVCISFGVPPTYAEAVRMTMRAIVKFWWLLVAFPSMCRLQARMVRRGTAPLYAVLQAGDGHVSSWTTALRRDLAWLHKAETCGDFYDFSDPHNGDCSDWVTFARDKPAQWKTRVKRAAKISILSLEAFQVSGFPVQPAEMLSCADCGKVCRGMGDLRAYQFRVHGKRCESRFFAFGSVCRWCMTDFRTRPRLIMHFRKCPACADGMRMYGMSTLGPEEMDELDAADRILAANMKRQGRALFDAASEPVHSVRVAMNEDG